MNWMIELPVILAILGFMMARQASRYLWAGTIATLLAYWTLRYSPPAWSLLTVWAVFLPIAVLLSQTTLRRNLIIKPLLSLYRKIMPGMSDTEREALEAGTVWWEADIFSGRPDWSRMLAFEAPALSDEEQAFIDGPVNELCNMVSDWEVTEELRDLTPETWAFLKANGFFGMIIPKQYGGLDFSANAHSAIVMKVASRSISAGVTVMVPNSLGPAKLLLSYGTEAQKDHYLPRLASGEEIPCFALTGPDAGSDAASMPDTGVVCRQTFEGKDDVLGIRLNWEKRYITLGPVATLLGLAFHLHDPDHLIGDEEDIGITLALIPTSTPGIEIGKRHFPMSQSFMNGPNRGTNVFIPMDWVIGGQEYVGQGWRMLMNSLSDGRAISLPALSTASGQLVSRSVGAYAAVRKQFKVPIGKFEGISEVLARIAGTTYIMNAARGFTTAALDSGEEPSVASAIIKYHTTERMRVIVNDAMDILAGRGISMGPNNFLGRGYQALPIAITVEGANILTRNLIATLNFETVTDEGFLNNPYRSVRYVDPGSALGFSFEPELYPETRTSNALGLRARYFLPYRAAVEGEYRFYTDTWDIESHTASLTYVHPWGPFTFEGKFRYHDQTGAAFFRDIFSRSEATKSSRRRAKSSAPKRRKASS